MKRLFILCLAAAAIWATSSCNNTSPHAVIETEFGKIKLKLFESTPQHTENFIKLAQEQFYDDLLFHRVINGFMIQGGDPMSKDAQPGAPLGSGGPGYQVPAEIGAYHFRGALAAARNGNPERKSSGSQFYIVQGSPVTDARLDAIEKRWNVKYTAGERALYKEIGGAPELDHDYTVYGEVLSGMEVVDKIATVAKNGSDRPNEDIKMTVRVIYE